MERAGKYQGTLVKVKKTGEMSTVGDLPSLVTHGPYLLSDMRGSKGWK